MKVDLAKGEYPVANMLPNAIPPEFHLEYGKYLYRKCVGRRDPTYFKVNDLIERNGKLMEFLMEAIVFNSPTCYQPQIMNIIVKNIRVLDEIEIENVGKTIVPKIQVMDD